VAHETDNYREIFVNDTPLLDTRAPVEFAKGAFPHTENLPLMTDREREAVGTCYKQQGQDAAIALGHSLVRGEIKARRVAAWKQFAERHPHGYLYCFRGGMRSAIAQQWLADAGVEYPRIKGGYKAMRNFLLTTLERIAHQQPLVILSGRTGCAKTHLLQSLPNQVDLEGLANHRGSAFGRRVGGQPAQIDFENRLAIDLLKCVTHHPHAPIVLEDESQLIGRCALPHPLFQAMQQAPVILLERPLEERVAVIFSDYILTNLKDYQQAEGGEPGFDAFAASLRSALYNIRKRLGLERYQSLAQLLDAALDAHRQGDAEGHKAWISVLLKNYYDPMYDYQLQKKQHRVQFRGDAGALRSWVAQSLS